MREMYLASHDVCGRYVCWPKYFSGPSSAPSSTRPPPPIPEYNTAITAIISDQYFRLNFDNNDNMKQLLKNENIAQCDLNVFLSMMKTFMFSLQHTPSFTTDFLVISQIMENNTLDHRIH